MQGVKLGPTSDLPVPVDPTMAIRGRLGAAGDILSHCSAVRNIDQASDEGSSLRYGPNFAKTAKRYVGREAEE